MYEDVNGVQLTFDFEQRANKETVESDFDKNVTDDVAQQKNLTTIGNRTSYTIRRNNKTGNRLDKLDSISDIRRIKDSFIGLSITETLIHNGHFSLEGKTVHNPV